MDTIVRVAQLVVVSLVLAGAPAAQPLPRLTEAGKPAQGKKEEAMHKPAPEMERLKIFMGSWATAEKHEPSAWGAGGEGKGSSVVGLGPGGFSLVEDYQSAMPLGPFTGHGVTVWDAGRRAYRLYWFDSMIPVALEQTCAWEGGDFVCRGEMTVGGRRVKSKTTTTAITPTSRVLTYESSGDGGPLKKLMTITYTRAVE